MSDVTQILSQIEQGHLNAAEKLLPLVYDELRKLAAARLAHEKPGQTLQATALVHEAYLRLVDVEKVQNWHSRGHFFGAAAEAMRRILVDNARRKRRERHGGQLERIDIPEIASPLVQNEDQILAVSDALEKFSEKDKQKADLVKLRYFVGMKLDEAAEALGVSVPTATRYWTYARAWLATEIKHEDR